MSINELVKLSKIIGDESAPTIDRYEGFKNKLKGTNFTEAEIFELFCENAGVDYKEFKKEFNKELKNNTKKEVKNMVDDGFWDDVEFQDSVFNPFFKVETDIVYTVKLVADASQRRSHQDNYDKKNPRQQWLFDVLLIDSDKQLTKEGMELDNQYTLALSRGADKAFRNFYTENGLDKTWGYYRDEDGKKRFKSPDVFKFKRTGDGWNTKYHFEL